MEAVESLAATRVPAMGQFLTPSQVPRESRAYKEELIESSDWVAANANLGKAEAACKLAREAGPKQLLKKAEAALKDAKAARIKLRQKLMHRVLVRHRLYVWKEGYDRLLLQASREELQRLTDVCEYPTMSEAQAVVFHLEAYAARERAAAAKAAAAVSRKRTVHDAVACAGVVHAADGDGGRAARRMAWRASRAEQQGYELEADEVQVASPSALATQTRRWHLQSRRRRCWWCRTWRQRRQYRTRWCRLSCRRCRWWRRTSRQNRQCRTRWCCRLCYRRRRRWRRTWQDRQQRWR